MKNDSCILLKKIVEAIKKAFRSYTHCTVAYFYVGYEQNSLQERMKKRMTGRVRTCTRRQ
jgi:hypothetical protein